MAWSSKVMIYLDRAIQLIFLNLLWIMGFLVGLGVLGIFPTTYATFHLVKKEMLFTDYPSYKKVTRAFFRAYKQSFLKMNGIGLVYSFLFYLVWINLQIVTQTNFGAAFFYYPTIFFMIYVLGTLVHLFPILLHTTGTMKQKGKLIVLAPFILPLQSIGSLLFFAVLLACAYEYSIIVPLCFVSTYVVCIHRFITGELVKKRLIKGEADDEKDDANLICL